MCNKLFFQWISRVCQIKYIHQNLRCYETIVQLLYLSGNHLPLLMICKNKMVTLKNLILKYIGVKNINILKRKCHVGTWNNSPWIDMLTHSDTLSWIKQSFCFFSLMLCAKRRSNKYLFLSLWFDPIRAFPMFCDKYI